jgi:predicted TIM-barrel fold metal-dependent hydrolase
MALEFFDCNVSYGMDVAAEILRPVHSVGELREEMDRAGVTKAIVSRVEHVTGGAVTANEMLAEDIAGCENLYGTWALLPSHTHELPPPADMPAVMKERRIIGWRLYPTKARFVLKGFALRDWLELAVARGIPVFANTAHGATLEGVADLMAEFPDLTLVLSLATDWPSDRFLRPFAAEFANVYLDMTAMFTDGGIESFVGEYGAGRLLYGSGFPHSYFGANMLMIRHAEISEAEKQAIAGGNMERIIGGVSL